MLPSNPAALPDIRNPVVMRCLNETRKVVNNIIRKYGKPDYIRIELARDVKLAGKKKSEALKINKERRRKRDKAKKFLTENNISVNSWNIEKHLLWEETGHRDIYSGDTICCEDLFRRALYEIEHIMPRSRSRDDSLNNLLLCRKDYNKKKGNQTPFEAFGQSNEWDDMVKRVKEFGLPYAKAKRFLRQEYRDEMTPGQLTDTAYAATAVRDFLAFLSLLYRWAI